MSGKAPHIFNNFPEQHDASEDERQSPPYNPFPERHYPSEAERYHPSENTTSLDDPVGSTPNDESVDYTYTVLVDWDSPKLEQVPKSD